MDEKIVEIGAQGMAGHEAARPVFADGTPKWHLYREHTRAAITALRSDGYAIVDAETLRKTLVALGLIGSLDADDDPDQWEDAQAKCDEARRLIQAATGDET